MGTAVLVHEGIHVEVRPMHPRAPVNAACTPCNCEPFAAAVSLLMKTASKPGAPQTIRPLPK